MSIFKQLNIASLFLFISFTYAIKCSDMIPHSAYSVDEVFECLHSLETTEEYNRKIVNEIKSELDAYAYKDIWKNPPQPEYDSNYFEKIDIDKLFDEIDVTTNDYYTFYSQLIGAVSKIKDSHVGLYAYSVPNHDVYFDRLYRYRPFDIIIEDDKNVYFVPNIQENYNCTTYKELNDNANVSVSTVNGKDVLQYYSEFSIKYSRLKYIHGKFSSSLSATMSMSHETLTQEELNEPLEITWSNGQNCTVKYEILYHEKSAHNPKKLLLSRMQLPIETNEPKKESVYNIETADGYFKCKVNDDKKVNMFVISSFYPEDENVNTDLETIAKCFELFDENTYPIGVVLPLNSGGYVQLGLDIANGLSNTLDYAIGSFRISDLGKSVFENKYNTLKNVSNCQLLYNPETKEYYGDWYSNPEVIYYGDVQHVRTQEFIIPRVWGRPYQLKKHPRKPTEVVILTDGYCFSTCSFFTKILKEQGGAIMVGFSGDPQSDDKKLFEVSESPSSVINVEELNTNGSQMLIDSGYYFQFSWWETFRLNFDYNETIPREFLSDSVDERIHKYYFNDDRIDDYGDAVKEIVKKYETDCNPDNDRLVLRSSECDSKLNIEHAHGGYKCGTNGKWSTECRATYCDDGYIFDFYKNKCTEDVCYEPNNDSSDSNNSNDNSNNDDSPNKKIILIVIISVVVFVLIILALTCGVVIFFYVRRKRKMSSDYQEFK